MLKDIVFSQEQVPRQLVQGPLTLRQPWNYNVRRLQLNINLRPPIIPLSGPNANQVPKIRQSPRPNPCRLDSTN